MAIYKICPLASINVARSRFYKLVFTFLVNVCLWSCSMKVNVQPPSLDDTVKAQADGSILLDVSDSSYFAPGELQFQYSFKIEGAKAARDLGFDEGNQKIPAYLTRALTNGGTFYIKGSFDSPEFHYVGGPEIQKIEICAKAKDSLGQESTEKCRTTTFTTDPNLGGSTSFTVGGTVAGLSGTLVLQNNGGDNLTINANGSFTFQTKIISHASYAVTAFSKPWTQSCIITHASGLIASSNITNVAVNCTNKTLSNPASFTDYISVDGGNATDFPRVAMDNSGNTIIVWNQDNSGGSAAGDIYLSEYRNGTWVHPTLLTDTISPAGSNNLFPNVAMDDNGNAIIVWYNNSSGVIQISEYRNGAWHHPANAADYISPTGLAIANEPKVAMNNNGDAVIVWAEMDSAGFIQIFKSEYHSGVWHHPVDIDDNISPDGTHAVEPKVAIDINGDIIISWYQDDGSGNFIIYMSEYRNGVWTHPANLADHISPAGTMASSPTVAMDNNGNAIITWNQDNGFGINRIYKSEYRSGTWTHPADLTDSFSPAGTQAAMPLVAMNDNGNAIIVWSQDEGSGSYQGFKSEYRNGSWTHPVDLTDNFSIDGVMSILYSVAMNSHDEIIIVGTQWDGSHNRECKSEYRNGAWTFPANASDDINPAFTDFSIASVAMSNNGDAVIVSSLSDGLNNRIYLSEYR